MTMLERYSPDELARFLAALNGAITEPIELVVIGGGALALGYGGTAATTDLDTFETALERIDVEIDAARRLTGLRIPIANSTVAQMPDGYRHRLKRVLPQLDRLLVFVLDEYDLAASKLLRGNQHDREQIAQLHGLAQLERIRLVERFESLIDDFAGDPREPWWALRHLVEEIWGEHAASEIDERMPSS